MTIFNAGTQVIRLVICEVRWNMILMAEQMYQSIPETFQLIGKGKLWFQTGADGARLASSGKSI